MTDETCFYCGETLPPSLDDMLEVGESFVVLMVSISPNEIRHVCDDCYPKHKYDDGANYCDFIVTRLEDNAKEYDVLFTAAGGKQVKMRETVRPRE
jgi:hypothetical protein